MRAHKHINHIQIHIRARAYAYTKIEKRTQTYPVIRIHIHACPYAFTSIDIRTCIHIYICMIYCVWTKRAWLLLCSQLQNLLWVYANIVIYVSMVRRSLLRHNTAHITPGDDVIPPVWRRPDTVPSHSLIEKWCGVVWCGVVWRGVAWWCDVMWCNVM